MSGLEASDHDASWAVCIIRTAPSAPLIFHPVHAEFTGHTRRLPQRGKKLSPQHSSGPSIWRKRRKRENSSHKGSGSPREGSRESDLVVCAGREGRECMLALLPMHTLPLHLSHQIHVTTPGSVRVHEGHFSTLESRQCHQRIRHTSNTAICQRGPYIVFLFILFCCSHLIPSFILSLAFVSCHWLLCNSCWSEGGGVLIISAAVRAQCTNQLCGIEEASCRVEAYFAPASGGVHERRYGYAVFSAFTAHAMPHSKKIVQPQPFLCMYVDMSVRTQERESYRDILFIHSFIHAFSYVAPFT